MSDSNGAKHPLARAIFGILAIYLTSSVIKGLGSDLNEVKVWLLFILYIFGFFGVGRELYRVYKLYKGNSGSMSSSSTDHGSAQWATRQQISAAGFEMNWEGLWIADGYMRKKQGHMLTVAGSGQGKGTCVIIPNLLVQPFGSYVVTDPKGENAYITARAQVEMGQRVYILDPWNEQQNLGAMHGISPSGFNPFDFIKANSEEMRDNCELIASYLVPDKPSTNDPYWSDRARTLIKTCLMHIITAKPAEEHNFWTLYKMLRLSGDDWLSFLVDMKDNQECDELISVAAGEFISMDPAGPTLIGIRSNAQNATSIFESPQLRQSLQKSEFSPFDLTNGNCTVYVVIPERFLTTHSAWLRLVIGLCLKACNSRPNRRVNFLLDEFAIMGKLKDAQNAYAYARGQNITMWAFVQSLSQLKEIYGEDGMNTLISNASVLQVFGVKDQFTKEYVSKALGDTTLIKQSITHTQNEDYKTSTGSSYSSFGRPLMTPEEVEKNPYILIMSEGIKFKLNKVAYFQGPLQPYFGNKYHQPPRIVA